MPNGKGWLACWDCIYYKRSSRKNLSLCEKHDQKLPDHEAPEYFHIFCSEFSPTGDSEKVLNGTVIKDGNTAYYHVYKPSSPFVNSGRNTIIAMENNKLYGYAYSQPGKIHVVMDMQ